MKFGSLAYALQYGFRRRLIAAIYRYRRVAVPAPLDLYIRNPRRILIVLSGLLGDSVMCTPVLPEARRIWPLAQITLLNNPYNTGLFIACPHVNRIKVCSADPLTLRKRSAVDEIRTWMRQEKFDLGIILSGDSWGPMLVDSGIPVRVGVRGQILEPCLNFTYDSGRPESWGHKEKLGALRIFGYEIPDRKPELWVSAAARDSARALLSDLGLREGAEYVTLHIFGSELRQWWPPEQVSELALLLRQELKIEVVLIGSRQKDIPCPDAARPFIDTMGKLSIPELLAVIEGSRLVITTDSGPFHIAGAMRRPLIGLFRASRPEHADRYDKARVLMHDHLSCRGRCKWNHCAYAPCRQMQLIQPSEICEAAHAILSDRHK